MPIRDENLNVDHEEEVAAGEYPVWSPYDAHEAAETLLRLLAIDEVEIRTQSETGLIREV